MADDSRKLTDRLIDQWSDLAQDPIKVKDIEGIDDARRAEFSDAIARAGASKDPLEKIRLEFGIYSGLKNALGYIIAKDQGMKVPDEFKEFAYETLGDMGSRYIDQRLGITRRAA